MTFFMILWVIVVVVAAGVLVALVASSWGGGRQLSPPATPVEITPVRQRQLTQPTQQRLQPEPQKRIQTRPHRMEPPAPPVSGQKNIKLRNKRINTRRSGLSPNTKCRITRRPVAECGCEHCRKLRIKNAV
jgi:hypothetical protein